MYEDYQINEPIVYGHLSPGICRTIYMYGVIGLASEKENVSSFVIRTKTKPRWKQPHH